MEKSKRPQAQRTTPDKARADRLAEELRANLLKRKAQARSRQAAGTGSAAGDPPE